MEESASLFLESNNDTDVYLDENEQPAEGTRIGENGIILRFHLGLLDGDTYSHTGELIIQPAVECKGHLEYWRQGKIHRDNNLPAVVSKGFTLKEYWENGTFLYKGSTD